MYIKNLCRSKSVIIAALISCLAASTKIAANQLYVYPLKHQSNEQQDRDRYDCHRWAVQQTGYDPSQANANNPTYLDPQPYRPSQPHVMRGATRGAPWERWAER